MGIKLLVIKSVFLFFILSSQCDQNKETTNDFQSVKVVYVLDGDSIVVDSDDRKRIKVRLIGIDAPEKEQWFASQSRQNLIRVLENKAVKISGKGTDQYGRLLAEVYADNENVNVLQVKTGNAWCYKRCRTKNYNLAEISARKNGVGLWRKQNPEPPWKYRENRRNKGL
jgi:endonuclease YncB( thermonuclease family)